MSSFHVGWSLRQNIPPGVKLVLVSVCEHADHAGVVQLRAELVAKEAGVALGTARKHLQDLVANGYLAKGPLRTYTVLLNNEPRPWGTRTAPGGARVATALAPAQKLDPDAGYVFVREGTRAWDAWCKAGHSRTLSTRRRIDGRYFTGWMFPTLFPGAAATATEGAQPATEGSVISPPPVPVESAGPTAAPSPGRAAANQMTEVDWHEFKP
jgi:hypothetical protein